MSQKIFDGARPGALSALVFALAAALAACATTPSAPPPAVAVAPPSGSACADLDFPVYFEAGSDHLTAPARQVLAAAAGRLRGCRVASGEIVGLASASAPSATADELSRRRARTVADALTAAGVPAPALDLRADGRDGARTAAGRAAPMRHAAQVFLHLARG